LNPKASTTKDIVLGAPLELEFGEVLPVTHINYSFYNHRASHLPIVYIMPSMSHSAHVLRESKYSYRGEGAEASPEPPGWWERCVGFGDHFGIDLNKFRVISASPLGGPYGSSSPLTVNPDTSKPYRRAFPQITPADQARAHAQLLDFLGIGKVHAIVGASMGGMQVLEFAAQFPDRYDKFVSICATGQTSPSTVALRSVQRSVVFADPAFKEGYYHPNEGPYSGLGLARMIGTICYRSRPEFDARFDWKANDSHQFEVERYLSHQANSFKERYDANCYLVLSRCMDLMDLGRGFDSYSEGVLRIPNTKQGMLLPFKSDALIPSKEMVALGSILGANGTQVHVEELDSLFGHDAFLKEFDDLNPRLKIFLESGVADVRMYSAETSGKGF